MSEENEALPEQITEAPDYDPENPDHIRRWELAGRPALDELDGDGNVWRPTITKVLQGDGSYLAIPAPEPNPVTDVEKEAMEKAAPAKALIVEDAMAARATLATAREKASGAKDLGEVKEAVQVLAEALDAVLAKMQGEQKK